MRIRPFLFRCACLLLMLASFAGVRADEHADRIYPLKFPIQGWDNVDFGICYRYNNGVFDIRSTLYCAPGMVYDVKVSPNRLSFASIYLPEKTPDIPDPERIDGPKAAPVSTTTGPSASVAPVMGAVTVYALPPDPKRLDCPQGVPFAVYVPSNNVIPVMGEVLVIPAPEPEPEPIAPVVEPATELTKKESLAFYGTPMTLKFPAADDFHLTGLTERKLADSWKVLSGVHFDALVASALEVRSKYQLCDWAYVQYLQKAMEKHYGRTNDAVFVQAFLLTQAGYRVRLARGNKGTSLLLLVASSYTISGHSYFTIDGQNYYYVDGKLSDPSADICRALFPTETLHYPYSDCEDRAILFSRLVRDIVGDDVVLLYYPGHLAAAVCFKSEVRGDGFVYNTRRYVVCDPTYKYGMVGQTMSEVRNSVPKIVVLE